MNSWQRLLAGAAAVAMIGAVPVDAQAKGLFDFLFGGPIRRQQADFPPPPPNPKAQRKASVQNYSGPVVKVSSPSYYNFSAEAMIPVDFGSLTALGRSASLDPQVGGTAFRESLSGLDGFELLSEKPIAAALTAYYAAAPDFIWVAGDGPNDRARAALRVLGEAGSYGLDPQDYSVAMPEAMAGSAEDKRSGMIRFEMTLSARVLRYLRDARNGRLDPNLLSGYHDFPQKAFDGKAELARMLRANDTRAALEAAHPQMPEYQQLRVELEALGGSGSAPEPVSVDPELILYPGESSAELPKLLDLIGRDLPPGLSDETDALAQWGSSETYVPELLPVIKAAQKRAGLRADGVIGPRTVKAVSGGDGGGSATNREEKVKLALEELRWLPRTLGDTRVFINEPAFTVTYFEKGAEKLSMRVVVGKPTNQTSFFYDQIEQIDYNPYWGIPQSILVNEMLPRLRRDPGYLDRAGYEVFDSKGQKVPSSSVAWGSYGAKIPFDVRQMPSEANALGELKILFPNKNAIYMHDTPQKKFFKEDVRAFSHGCVRLERPRDMAAALLGKPVDYVAEKLTHGHSSEKVPGHIPIYISYFTAWPDAAGKVDYFKDVYSRDKHLAEALEKVEAARNPSS